MEQKYRNVVVDGETVRGERALGGGWIQFVGGLTLLRIDAALDVSEDAFNRIWALQDGYGETGFTPAQGYDWSGIRDSSPEAKAQMEAVAREYVSDQALAWSFGIAVDAISDLHALPTAERRYLTCAETAKLVRAALKETFPGQKFSVRSDTYSGGASIRVAWTDGPTATKVDEVTNRFRGADFDGMIDLKTHRDSRLNGERVSFGADYIFSSRKLSDEFKAEFVAAIEEQTGRPFEPNGDYGDDVIRWKGELFHAQWGSDLIYRMSGETSR